MVRPARVARKREGDERRLMAMKGEKARIGG